MPETETPVGAIDHLARAKRLADFIDNHASKLNSDCLDSQGVRIDEEFGEDVADEDVRVPHRYALGMWDGSSSYIEFHATVEDAESGASGLGGDYPFAPSRMVDLDTGHEYEPVVSVSLVAQRWAVPAKVSIGENVYPYDAMFATEEQARAFVAEPGDAEITGEPRDTWAVAA